MSQGDPEPQKPFHLEDFRLAAQKEQIKGEGWASPEALEAVVGADFPGDQESAEGSGSFPARARAGWHRFSAGLLTRLNPWELTIVIASAVGIAIAAYLFTSANDAGTVGLFALVALVPLSLVLVVMLRADRFAPLPGRYWWFAAAWGAGVAPLLAGVLNTVLLDDFTATTGDIDQAEFLTGVLVAPATEELLKGGGVILVLLIARRRVVSRINGLVIGGVAGASFAFVENIQYFIAAQGEGSSVLGMTIFARSVMSPFIHPMATSMIGYFFASAMLKQGRAGAWAWRTALGFCLAMGLHSLWNLLASTAYLWLLLYLVIEVPLFAGWLIWVSALGRSELKKVGQGLTSYVAAGWLTEPELLAVSTLAGRRYSLRWARKVGGPARKSMRAYMRSAGRLGADQLNMERWGPDLDRVELAKSALRSMTQSREVFTRAGEFYYGSRK